VLGAHMNETIDVSTSKEKVFQICISFRYLKVPKLPGFQLFKKKTKAHVMLEINCE
jgi:hypothetical protein